MYPYIYKVWLPGNVSNANLPMIMDTLKLINLSKGFTIRFTELSKQKAMLSCNFPAEELLKCLMASNNITGFIHHKKSKGFKCEPNFVYSVLPKPGKESNLKAHLFDYCQDKACTVGPIDTMQIWSSIGLMHLLTSLVKLNILASWTSEPEVMEDADFEE